jgi:hypothetical protein
MNSFIFFFRGGPEKSRSKGLYEAFHLRRIEHVELFLDVMIVS